MKRELNVKHIPCDMPHYTVDSENDFNSEMIHSTTQMIYNTPYRLQQGSTGANHSNAGSVGFGNRKQKNTGLPPAEHPSSAGFFCIDSERLETLPNNLKIRLLADDISGILCSEREPYYASAPST